MEKQLTSQHGVICRLPAQRFGYFGWPSVARMDDGTLIAVSSGLRAEHVCPFGKTVMNTSEDNGRTWSAPRVIQDSPIDDRDAGVVSLGSNALLVSWFRSDTRMYAQSDWLPASERKAWAEVFSTWTEEMVGEQLGSWVMLSRDGGKTWGDPVRAPVSAPHGPIQLRSGDLLYLGKSYGTWKDMGESMISAARSHDGGHTWRMVGEVPLYRDTSPSNYHEPHVVELPSGRLIGMIRVQDYEDHRLAASGIPTFSLMQCTSDDGGCTWTQAEPLGFHGSPPHLLRHSSGRLILTYGYRLAPYGQRVALSDDDGQSWDHDWVLRADGPDGDLGYPATVELTDGSLLTVYYQKYAPGEKCSLLYSQWALP